MRFCVITVEWIFVPPRKHVAKIQLFFGLEYENQVFLHIFWKFGTKSLSLHRKIGKTGVIFLWAVFREQDRG